MTMFAGGIENWKTYSCKTHKCFGIGISGKCSECKIGRKEGLLEFKMHKESCQELNCVLKGDDGR